MSDARQIPVAQGYDLWSATYDTSRNATRDAAMAVVRAWTPRFAGRAILELGCGTGLNTEHLARHASHVIGLDLSDGMLAVARRRLDTSPVELRQHDLETPLPFADASVDVVVETLVLEHIANLPPLFEEIARVMKPGGAFLASELHPYRQLLGRQARFAPAGEEGSEILVQAYPHSIAEFANGAIAAGLRIVQMEETCDASGEPRLFSLVAMKS